MRKEFLVAWQVFVEKSRYLLTGICIGFRKNMRNLAYSSIDKDKNWLYVTRFFSQSSNKGREPVVLAFFSPAPEYPITLKMMNGEACLVNAHSSHSSGK